MLFHNLQFDGCIQEDRNDYLETGTSMHCKQSLLPWRLCDLIMLHAAVLSSDYVL
jgi:hypothetical protein